MLTIQELFSWFSEEAGKVDLTRVGEADLIESIQALTLAPSKYSNLFMRFLCGNPKNPPSRASDSGTAALGNTGEFAEMDAATAISVLIHDFTSGEVLVTTTFWFVILISS